MMTRAIVFYELRGNFALFALIAISVIGLLLLKPIPIFGDPGVHLLSLVGGVGIALGLMTDGGTQAYVFSRGIPRRRLFATRFILGIALVCGIALLAWAAIAFGVRSKLHLLLMTEDAHFYPMIGQFEAGAALESLKTMLIGFVVSSFYLVFRGLCSADYNGTASGMRRFVPEAIVVLPLLFVAADEYPRFVATVGSLWFVFGAMLIGAVTLFAARDLEAA